MKCIYLTLQTLCLFTVVNAYADQGDNPRKSANTITISVVDIDGNYPPDFAVSFEPAYDIDDERETVVHSTNGMVTVELPAAAIYNFELVVPGYDLETFFLDNSRQVNKMLKVGLSKLQFDEAINNINISLYREDKEATIIPMQRWPDGTFYYEAETTEDEYLYVLENMQGAGLAYPNPDATSYMVFDDEYYAVAKPANDKVSISFKPDYTHNTARAKTRFSDGWNKRERDLLSASQEIVSARLDAQIKAAQLTLSNSYVQNVDELLVRLKEQYPLVPQGFYAAYKALIGGKPSDYLSALQSVQPDSIVWDLPLIEFGDFIYATEAKPINLTSQQHFLNLVEKYSRIVNTFRNQSHSDLEKAYFINWLRWAHLKLGNKNELKALHEYFKQNLMHIPKAKLYLSLLVPPKISLGDIAPKFLVSDLESNDGQFNNDTFKGKYVLVDFWATWCPPCREEMPVLDKIYKQYADKGFEILSISADETIEDIEKYRKNYYSMPWKHHFLEFGVDAEVFKQFDVKGYPSAFVISPNGQILAMGSDARSAKLEAFLAKAFSDGSLVAE